MNTLFDKIWDAHVVQQVPDGPTQLYIDRLYCHEVTSPQAFDGMRARGLKCFRPAQIYCMPDHNTPTHDQDKPIADARYDYRLWRLPHLYAWSNGCCGLWHRYL